MKNFTELEALINRLPTPLAHCLNDYLTESHPYVKLHRLCDAAETTCRFLAITGLSELQNNDLLQNNENFQLQLIKNLEKPTFGQWIALLAETSKALTESQSPIEGTFKRESTRLTSILREEGQNENRTSYILPLRNSLAHDGRFTNENSESLLNRHGHSERFERYWLEAADFLKAVQLYALDDSGILFNLTGLENFPRVTSKTVLQKINLSDFGKTFVFWPTPKLLIKTSPLLTYHQSEPNDLHGEITPATIQVYSKINGKNIIYTVINSQLGRNTGTRSEYQLFLRHFPLHEWRKRFDQIESDKKRLQVRSEVLKDIKTFRFRDVVQDVIEPFVGRDAEVDKVLNWVENESGGIAFIPGEAGIGKSAFSANLSSEFTKPQYKKRFICFRHFFKNGDHRCSFNQFCQGILLQMEEWTGLESKYTRGTSSQDLIALLVEELQLRSKIFANRVVLLLDSIDELSQTEMELVLRLISNKLNNIVWLVTARPSETLSVRFRELNAWFPFGERGLPRLSEKSIRTLLINSVIKYSFILEEREEKQFLKTLVAKADGIPLYINLVIAEIEREGTLDYLSNPELLPQGLTEYYRSLLSRSGMEIDAAKQLFPEIIALLALLKSAAPEETISDFLSDHNLRSDPEWSEIFDKALAYASPLIRQSYVWESEYGWTLYHESFREFLIGEEFKSYRDSKIAPIIKGARRRIESKCYLWRESNPSSYTRAYIVRYACKHFIESKQLEALYKFLIDIQYVEERIEPEAIYELLADFKTGANLFEDQRKSLLISEMGNAIEGNGDFLLSYPNELYQILHNNIDSGCIDYIVSTQWDTYFSKQPRSWLKRFYPKTPLMSIRGGGGVIRKTFFSPCGEYIAFGTFGEFDLSKREFKLGLLAVATSKGKRLACFNQPPGVISIPLAFSGDSRYLFFGQGNKIVRWDFLNDCQEEVLELTSTIVASESGTVSLPTRMLDSEGKVYLWASNSKLPRIEHLGIENKRVVLAAKFSPKTRFCFLVLNTREVCLYDGAQARKIAAIPENVDLYPDVIFDQYGGIMPCQSSDTELEPGSRLNTFRLQSGFLTLFTDEQISRTLEFFGAVLNPCMEIDCESLTMAFLSFYSQVDDCDFDWSHEKVQCKLSVWSIEKMLFNEIWTGLNAESVKISSDRQSIFLTYDSGKLSEICLTTGAAKQTLFFESSPIPSLATRDDGILGIGSTNLTIFMLSGKGEACEHRRDISRSVLSSDRSLLASGDIDGGIVFWSLPSMSIIQKIYPTREKLSNFIKDAPETCYVVYGHYNSEIKYLEFDATGHLVVSFDVNGGCFIWNARASGESKQIDWEEGYFMGGRSLFSISSDKRRIAFARESGLVVVRNFTIVDDAALFESDAFSSISAIALCPRGILIAVWDSDQISVLSVDSGILLFKVRFQDLGPLDGFLNVYPALDGTKNILLEARLPERWEKSYCDPKRGGSKYSSGIIMMLIQDGAADEWMHEVVGSEEFQISVDKVLRHAQHVPEFHYEVFFDLSEEDLTWLLDDFFMMSEGGVLVVRSKSTNSIVCRYNIDAEEMFPIGNNAWVAIRKNEVWGFSLCGVVDSHSEGLLRT